MPAAIDFHVQNDWPDVRRACNQLLSESEQRILAMSGLPPISPSSMWSQMRLVLLPGKVESYQRLWEENRIIAPVGQHRGQPGIRISVQAYNSPADLDILIQALQRAASAS